MSNMQICKIPNSNYYKTTFMCEMKALPSGTYNNQRSEKGEFLRCKKHLLGGLFCNWKRWSCFKKGEKGEKVYLS